MNYAICSKCNLRLPDNKEYFYMNKQRKKLSYSECKECFKKRINERARAQKEFMLAYKGSKCVICSYNNCKGALEFHHKDPSGKEFKLSNTYVSKENLIRELDKCVLLCSNCHRETHEGLHPEYLAS